jgi:hypothetical protein
VHRVKTAFLVATVGTLAMAATAQAATVAIAPVKACYLTGESDTLSGTGFTPNGNVAIAVDGTTVFSLTADASGAIGTTLQFGTMKAVSSHTLTATDAANPALTATVTFTGTTHQVATRHSRGKPGKKVKLRGYGFLFGPKAYMHVNGHGIHTNTFLARPKAPCGTFSVKKKLVRKGAPIGKYRVQFDAKKKFSKKTRPRLVYPLTVFPVASGASAFAGVGLNQAWTKLAR